MSKPTSDHLVEINDHDAKSEAKAGTEPPGSVEQPSGSDNQPQQQNGDPAIKLLGRMSKRLRECLHNMFEEEAIERDDKSVDNNKTEERERKRAYKSLMEDLEGEKKEHPLSVAMWIVNGCVLLMFIIFLATTRSVHGIHEHWLLNLRIHRWVGIIMVIVCGCPCIGFVTWVVSEPFVWLRKMENRYIVFYARQLKRSVDVTLWFFLVLWVWYTWFRSEIVKDKQGADTLHVSVDEYQEVLRIVVKQITRFLLALTIGAVIWTLKSAVFLRLLADLHFKDLTVRIQHTILDLHGLQFIDKGQPWSFLMAPHNRGQPTPSSGVGFHLKSANPSVNTQNNSMVIDCGQDEAATAAIIAGQGQSQQPKEKSFWFNVSQLQKETVPIWILKLLTYTYMQHMKTKPPFLERLKDTNNDEKLLDEARKMLEKVTGTSESCDITKDHLRKYGLQGEEMTRVFKLFAPKEEGKVHKITRDQFLRWAVLAVKNCLGLERTIESSKRIFWKLDILMSSCVVVITLVIWLLLTEIVSTAQIAILFAPFLSASFIFGESLKRSFDGIIFVFGMHPFDVGDRVKINDVEMKVNVMNILTTVFIKYDTGVEAIYPNSELTTMPIVNLDTAPDQPDTIDFTVSVKTRPELIRDLRIKIMKTLDDDLSYTSSTVVAKKEITGNEVTLSVYFKYLVSYLSAETRAQRRSRILCKIIRLRNEMEIAQEKKSELISMEEAYGILRCNIDAKIKLPQIEKHKNIIIRALKSSKSLRGEPEVLFTSMEKEKIAMDVRMKHTKDLSKDELLNQIKNAIKTENENIEQRTGNQVEVVWHTNSDWDDAC